MDFHVRKDREHADADDDGEDEEEEDEADDEVFFHFLTVVCGLLVGLWGRRLGALGKVGGLTRLSWGWGWG